jgi:hypothetical protein
MMSAKQYQQIVRRGAKIELLFRRCDRNGVSLEMIGKRFGFLVVEAYHSRNKRRSINWLCRCDCGGTSVVATGNLRNYHVMSCCSMGRVKHGMSRRENIHPLFKLWVGVRRRCLHPHSREWKWYGGRGIKLCEAWHSFPTFAADIEAEIGPRVSLDFSLDRIDNDGNYEPGNVRWATDLEQANNRRRYNAIRKPFEELCYDGQRDRIKKLRALGLPAPSRPTQAARTQKWNRQKLTIQRVMEGK